MNARAIQSGMIKSLQLQWKKLAPFHLGCHKDLNYRIIYFLSFLPLTLYLLVVLLVWEGPVPYLGLQLTTLLIVTVFEILMVSIPSFDHLMLTL